MLSTVHTHTHTHVEHSHRKVRKAPCRSDGTLAYFFSKEDLQQRCEAVGFECAHVKYVCLDNKNRKTGVHMRRVFVQGRFTVPVV